MKNKLLILIKRKRRIFFIIILLLALLGGGIRILECYHKEFLFTQMIMNEYFKAELSSGFLDFLYNYFLSNEYENFYDYLLTICKEIYHLITFPLFSFIKNYRAIYNTIYIEKIKSALFKKHMIYTISVWSIFDVVWNYVVAMDISHFRVHKIADGFNNDIRVNQKVIKNFNKLIVTEKIRIDSCEDCLKFIRAFVELTSFGDLVENYEQTFKVYCYGHDYYENEKPRKIEVRVTSPFILKPDLPEYADYYYVELYIRKIVPIVPELFFTKKTFKVKNNGIVYDFHEIVFGPVVWE